MVITLIWFVLYRRFLSKSKELYINFQLNCNTIFCPTYKLFKIRKEPFVHQKLYKTKNYSISFIICCCYVLSCVVLSSNQCLTYNKLPKGVFDLLKKNEGHDMTSLVVQYLICKAVFGTTQTGGKGHDKDKTFVPH